MTEDTTTQPDASVDEATRRYYLEVMGIQCWQLIDSQTENMNVEPAQANDAGSALQQLDTDIQQCNRCQLHTSRQQAIAGRGSSSAELMFVLLSPDKQDDASGQLCSGEADVLFTKMLAAINVSIDDVYITSLLKCSVPPQHTISTTELHYCNAYLKQQVQLVQPKLLVVLGDTAARCLLQKNSSLDDLRERVNTQNAETVANQFESVPLFVSYSPQELIQQPENKRKAWLDLQQIQKIIEANKIQQ